MSDRPKTGMRERARRRATALQARLSRTEATDQWLRDRKAALSDMSVKAKRRRARIRKSAFGTGRVPKRYRVEKPAPVTIWDSARQGPMRYADYGEDRLVLRRKHRVAPLRNGRKADR
jgi:hypothetical protein